MLTYNVQIYPGPALANYPGPALANYPGPALANYPGPALANAGPNARPKRGAPLSSDFMTSSCSFNRVTIVVERKYAVQH